MAKTSGEIEKREVKTVVNAINGLNLREAPHGAILTTLKHGTPVKVVSEKRLWTEVKAGKISGWVMSQYLRKEK